MSLVLFVVTILIGIPAFFLFYQKPTCFDRKLNGDEKEVDCGGSCQLICSAESLPIISKGDPRVLTVAPNVFEVVALLDNPNSGAEISRAHYTLKIFDSVSTIALKTIEGETFVPKGATFAIFAGPFTLEAGLVPTRAILEWDKGSLIWHKNTKVLLEIIVRDKLLSNEDSSPRFEAMVGNGTLESISNIDFVALISDEEGNIFAASKTFIDTLAPNENAPIIFTWPRPFSKKAAQLDIITRILPDRSFIK